MSYLYKCSGCLLQVAQLVMFVCASFTWERSHWGEGWISPQWRHPQLKDACAMFTRAYFSTLPLRSGLFSSRGLCSVVCTREHCACLLDLPEKGQMNLEVFCTCTTPMPAWDTLATEWVTCLGGSDALGSHNRWRGPWWWSWCEESQRLLHDCQKQRRITSLCASAISQKVNIQCLCSARESSSQSNCQKSWRNLEYSTAPFIMLCLVWWWFFSQDLWDFSPPYSCLY